MNARWAILFLVVALVAGCGTAKKRSNEAEAHYILGVSYLRENNPTQALREFLLAEEADPRNPEVQAGLGQAYSLKKAFAEAEKHYLQALKTLRDDPRLENNLADLYLAMERWDDAVRLFRKASSNLLFANPEVALTGMGYAYFQKGEYLQAVTAYKEALGHQSRYPQAHLRLGEAYYALDKTGLAVDEYRQALKIAPGYVLAHYNLGIAYVKLRETEKAVSSFREVLRLAPDSEAAGLAGEYLKILK